MTSFRAASAARFFSVLAAALLPLVAAAHAFLDHASPRVGSTVHGAPGEVRVWFTQELEPAFSNLRVVDQAGTPVDQRNSAVDPSDRTLMKVSLPNLPGHVQGVLARAFGRHPHDRRDIQL